MTTQEDLIKMKQRGALTDDEFLLALNKLQSEQRKEKQEFDFEKIKKQILFSVVLLGIFSVLTGLGLIIASNWDKIPAIMKVSGGLAILGGALIALFDAQKNGRSFLTEVLSFISFGLIGGNIALIQQVYHLSLTWQEGSLLWWALSLPLLAFTKRKLLPLCSVGLLVFSLWDILWRMNYMLVAGILFVFMMATHFFRGKTASFLRELAFIFAITLLYFGDISSRSGAGVIGVISTTLFVILALGSPKTDEGTVRYYNCLFLFVAWRIFLLFWNAYYNLMHIGVLLVIFGSVLLTGVGVYTYFFKQIQQAIRNLIKHE